MFNGWVVGAVVLGIVLGLLLWGAVWRGQSLSVESARRQFQQQREHLEAKFFQLAASSGKPRGLRWKECEWGDQLEFARDRRTGQFVALAGMTIAFEAVEGGDMEGLPAVANLRSATGVFACERGRWHATGRAVFNLNPGAVLEHFRQQYERVVAT